MLDQTNDNLPKVDGNLENESLEIAQNLEQENELVTEKVEATLTEPVVIEETISEPEIVAEEVTESIDIQDNESKESLNEDAESVTTDDVMEAIAAQNAAESEGTNE